jgi:hypothetical protein
MGFWGDLIRIGAPIAMQAAGVPAPVANAAGSAIGTKVSGGSWGQAAAAGAGGALAGKGGYWGNLGRQLANPTVISSTTGALAAGKQAGREAENLNAKDTAAFKLRESEGHEDALQGRANLDLRQRGFGMDSQNNAFGNAIRAALLKNMQDVSMDRPEGIPTMSFKGGMRPSALGTEGREAAALMHSLSMDKLKSGEQFDKLPALERTAPAEFKKPGFWENALGAVSVGSGAMAGAQQMGQQSEFQNRILQLIAEYMKQEEAQQGGGGAGVPRQPRLPGPTGLTAPSL